jgi:hypothetical protein
MLDNSRLLACSLHLFICFCLVLWQQRCWSSLNASHKPNLFDILISFCLLYVLPLLFTELVGDAAEGDDPLLQPCDKVFPGRNSEEHAPSN